MNRICLPSTVSTRPKVKKSSAWTAAVIFWNVGVYPSVGVGLGVVLGIVEVGLVLVLDGFVVVLDDFVVVLEDFVVVVVWGGG